MKHIVPSVRVCTALAAALLVVWAGAQATTKPSAATAALPPAPPPAVAVATPLLPVASTASARLPAGASALGCLIQASAVVEVGASVFGVLDSVAVERGDMVRKGQLLAQLESNVERTAVALAQTRVQNQADILSARSQKDFAAKKAARTAELTDLKFVSMQAREQADTEASMADMKLVQAIEQRSVAAHELAMAKAQLAQRTVASPISGVVVDRYASAGERIENRPLLKLAQIDPLRVEVVLPASQFKSVRAGMTAHVVPDLAGTKPQVATVAIVDRVIDAGSNTFRARLTLPNRDLGLPPGVRCKVEFGNSK